MNQETRLRDFAARQQRLSARPARRGGIDPACRLPSLAELERIDARAEAAVAQARTHGDARGRADATAEPLDGCGPGAGHGGADRAPSRLSGGI